MNRTLLSVAATVALAGAPAWAGDEDALLIDVAVINGHAPQARAGLTHTILITITDAVGEAVPAFENADRPPDPLEVRPGRSSLKLSLLGCFPPPDNVPVCRATPLTITSRQRERPGVYRVKVAQPLVYNDRVPRALLVEASVVAPDSVLIGQPRPAPVVAGGKALVRLP